MDFSFITDRAFLHEMLQIALPVAIQQLITASLNMIDVLMVGQLGETAIAATGLSNQVFFVLTLFMFGITTGMSIFTAQYWGKREVQLIRKVLGMCIVAASSVALIFTLATTFAPRTILSFYTNDPQVLALGVSYLRIVGSTYLLVAVSTSIIAVLRSMQLVKLTVIASVIALVIKTILGYILIFGLFGLPRLGIVGAAIGTATCWMVEFSLIIIFVYRLKTPLAANPLTFLQFDRAFFERVLITVIPAALNEVVWSLGITTYNAVYAHIGTTAIAAINVTMTIEELAFVVFFGFGSACAVLVGNLIGAGKKELAYNYVRRFLTMSLLCAILIGLVIIPLRDPFISFYKLSEQGALNAHWLMFALACSLWLRVINFILFIGALRAGGDTRFGLITELITIWTVGVPMALIGGFVLKLPIYYVYGMVLVEEAVKCIIVLYRFRSKKWIHDLVNAEAGRIENVPL